MACKEGTVQPQLFVEEIDYEEIVKLEVVGKGSFGVVWKGKWRDTYVAVKHIDSEAERKAFAVEVRQLSRVSHPNIVKLYGACTQNPVCLVMEYAEGGSLYNVLHCRPQPKYSAGHAMSWALQCAHGVAYLHSMTPKALIHRDLKPPNLLLVMGGKVLKICDFGTACDKKTYMTNNKGSAAWMAPEVFEGSNYTEKCDVFSWGIILWEVLSRCKPFDEVGGPAFRIMWAVHKGERPPLIDGCPPLIEHLMTRCWDKDPLQRPPMDEVVRVMSLLFPFFEGQDEPVQYSEGDSSLGSEIPDEDFSLDTMDSQADLSDYYNNTTTGTQVYPSVNGCRPELGPVSARLSAPLEVAVDPAAWDLEGEWPQLNGSHSRRSELGPVNARLSAPLEVAVDPAAWDLEGEWPQLNGSYARHMELRRTAGLDKMVATVPTQPQGSSREELDNVYLVLDPQLQPIPPDTACRQSVQVFEEHKQLAQEYLKVQTQIAYLSRTMGRLAERLSEAEGLSQLDLEDSERHSEELRKLENEKDSLLALHRNLKLQLELIRSHRHGVNSDGSDGWVVVHQDPAHAT